MPLSIRTSLALRWALALFVGGLCAAVPAGLLAAVPARRTFDLPAGRAEPALKRLSQQAGVQLVFDSRLVEDVTVKAVRGEFTPLEAAQRLLAGTVLRARRDELSGILSVERAFAAAPLPEKKASARADSPPTTRAATEAGPESSNPTQQTNPHPMKSHRSLLAALSGWLVATTIVEAQTTPPSIPAKDDAVQLSPFEVAAGKDNGYAASSTLAGTRLRTDLRDVAASITVVTKQFMDDIGASNLDDLLTYTLGTEAAGVGGNFSNHGLDGNFTDVISTLRGAQGANRVRGIGSAELTRDFFITSTAMDGFNTERVEINRGPNAMLFGLGSAAGIINHGLIKAQTNRTGTKVDTQFGQHDTHRIALDHNQVLIKDRLALRVATLYGDKRYQLEPAFVRDERIFATATARPWKGAVFRASAEHSKQFSNKHYNSTPTDNISWWWALGKPVYDPTTGIATYLGTRPTDPNLQPITATGGLNTGLIAAFSTKPLLIQENPDVTRFGVTGLNPSVQAVEGFNNRVRLNAAGTAFVNDGMRLLQSSKNYIQRVHQTTSPALFNFWRDFKLTDPSIFNFYDQMLEGPNKREWAFWKTYNASFEQRLGAHAGVEVAFFKEALRNGHIQPFQFRNHAINIDINTRLPNGLPNPNLGRPFITSADGFDNSPVTDREAFRATAYYEHDFTRNRKESWLRKALGRHVFTGSFTNQKREGASYGGRNHALGLDYYTAETANETRAIALDNGNRFLQRTSYIGPSLLNAATPQNGGVRGVTADNSLDGASSVNVLYYQTPAAAPVSLAQFQNRTFSLIQKDKYDFSQVSIFPSRSADKVESSVFVANSYWWDNTLVSTLGWRKDAFQTFDAGASPTDPVTGLKVVDPNIWKWTAPALDGSETSFSYGLVLHQPPFLRGKLPLGASVSLTYNVSNNFRPTAQRFDFFGNSLAAPTGSTKEWGALLSVFHGKLELRFTKYETQSTLATATALREPQNVIVRRLDSQIELNSNADYQAVASPAALAAWNQWQQGPDAKRLFETFLFRFSPGPNGTTIVDRDDRIGTVVGTTDVLGTGYEFDVTYNPTRNWRIAFNAARQQAVSGNTGAAFVRMLATLQPIWGGSAAALPDSATSGNNLGQTFAQVKSDVDKAVLLDGSPSPELRRWRFNVVSNYSFNEGRLKGWRLGGAYRWQDRSAVGYPVRVLADGSGVFDVTKPFFGPTESNVDGWIGYSRRLGQKIRWSAQLNVRNIGVGNRLIPVNAQPDGTIHTMRIAEPQTWLLTNSFEF
jgi:outer membrane receptor protein involved in Fe transport